MVVIRKGKRKGEIIDVVPDPAVPQVLIEKGSKKRWDAKDLQPLPPLPGLEKYDLR